MRCGNPILPSLPNGKKDNSPPGKNGSNHKRPKLEEEVALLLELKNHPGNLAAISSYVKRNNGKMLELPGKPGIYLRVCDLNGTIYMGQTYMLESWQNLYLPQKTRMEVLGTVDNCSSIAPGMQLVFLVAEDGRVFFYESEDLNLVANNLNEFVKYGFKEPITKHEYPHYISDEEEETVRKDTEVQKIRQRSRDFVDNGADELAQLLRLV